MIASRGYYYLLSSLPELRFGEPPPLGLADLLSQYGQEIEPDRELVDVLVLRNDTANLKAALAGGEDWREPAVYTREILEQAIADGEGLPEFMIRHIAAASAGEEDRPRLDAAGLDKDYLLYAAARPNVLLREYFTFELRLRNVLAAIRGREAGLEVSRDATGDPEDLYLMLIRDNRAVPDFGLQGEAPWISRVLAAFESADPLQIEAATDRIRFDHVEELTSLRDFQIEVVLGYILRLQILERWSTLEASRGYEYLRSMSKHAMELR